MSIKNILINSGKLYADNRGNAVFLLLGKEKKVVGAELQGTNDLRWHGMVPGSRKDLETRTGALLFYFVRPEKRGDGGSKRQSMPVVLIKKWS